MFNATLVDESPGEIETGLLLKVFVISPALAMHEVRLSVEFGASSCYGLLTYFERVLSLGALAVCS